MSNPAGKGGFAVRPEAIYCTTHDEAVERGRRGGLESGKVRQKQARLQAVEAAIEVIKRANGNGRTVVAALIALDQQAYARGYGAAMTAKRRAARRAAA